MLHTIRSVERSVRAAHSHGEIPRNWATIGVTGVVRCVCLRKCCYRCVCRISTEQNRKNAAPSYSAVCSAHWLTLHESRSLRVCVCVCCAHERRNERRASLEPKKSQQRSLSFSATNFFRWWLCRLSSIGPCRCAPVCVCAGSKCLCRRRCCCEYRVTVSAVYAALTYVFASVPLCSSTH